MNFRLTAILFGLMLVLAVVLLGITLLDDTPAVGDTLLEELTSGGAKPDKIDAIEIERTDPPSKLVLSRTARDRWEIVEPVKARADRAAVDALVSTLLDAKPTASAEAGGKPAERGLEPPSLKVTLRQGSERSSTLNIGDVSFGGDQAVAFVTTSARPSRTMAVRRTAIDSLFREAARKEPGKAGALAKWTADYRDKRLLGTNPHSLGDEITAVKLTAKGQTAAFAHGKDGWNIVTPPLGEADVDGAPPAMPPTTAITGIRPLLSILSALQAASPDDFIESPKDLREYGLNPDNPDLIRAEATTRDGTTTVLLIGKKVVGTPNKVYVRVEGDSSVVKAQAPPNLDGLAAIAANPAALRNRTLLDVERDRIDAIDITVGGQTTKLRKVGTTWDSFGGPNDPQHAGLSTINELLTLLSEKRTIKDFSPADPKTDAAFAPNDVKAEVKIWSDIRVPENADPKKEPDLKDQKPVTLIFGKKEGDAIHVRRVLADGTKLDVLLPESVNIGAGAGRVPFKLPDAVAKSRLDFLDPKIESFVPNLATKLNVMKGTDTIEVSKSSAPPDLQNPTGKWVYDRPDARKGQTANAGEIDKLLGQLAMLSAVKIVDEQPTPEKLAGWGLDPKAPKLKVTVSLNADVKERSYEFGNETDDKANVYARASTRPAVFLLPRATVETFRTADLRDPTVVAFDPNKVKNLTLAGWKELTGSTFTLALESKDGNWIAKTPTDFKPDGVKIKQLLIALLTARAKAFVGPSKPEFGFGADAPKGLVITLEMEDGTKHIVNLGAETDGGQTYYISTGQPPGEAMTVDATPFKPFKEKPAALQK